MTQFSASITTPRARAIPSMMRIGRNECVIKRRHANGKPRFTTSEQRAASSEQESLLSAPPIADRRSLLVHDANSPLPDELPRRRKLDADRIGGDVRRQAHRVPDAEAFRPRGEID